MVVRLGAEAVDQRIERFFRALDGGVGIGSDRVAYVDMRYTHGFAVGWRETRTGAVAVEEAATDV